MITATRQDFDTADHLQVLIERDPVTGELLNLLANPTAELGAWGWLTPVNHTNMTTFDAGGGVLGFVFLTADTQACYFTSDYLEVTPGNYLSAAWSVYSNADSPWHVPAFEWFDIDKDPLGTPTYPAVPTAVLSSDVRGQVAIVPAGCAYARLRIALSPDSTGGAVLAGAQFAFTNPRVVQTPAAVDFPVDDCPNVYWSDVVTAGADAYGDGFYGAGPYGESEALDLAGELCAMTTTRAAGPEAGTATLTFTNPALDPAVSPLLRPGRRLVINARADVDDAWVPIFTGRTTNARTDYTLDRGQLRPAITVEAADAVADLEATDQPNGAASVGECVNVLEPAGVPWNCDGVTFQAPAVTVASVDDNATVLDQLHRARDTALAHAWVDRRGVVMVRTTPSPTIVATFGEDDYTADAAPDFDTDRCINVVSVVFRAVDGTETTYGPYVEDGSRRRWGPHRSTFTVHGIATGTIPAYARAILAANATPTRRVGQITIPMTMGTLPYATGVDLWDAVTLTHDLAGIDAATMRVATITHDLTGDPATWLLTLDLAVDGRAAIPTTRV